MKKLLPVLLALIGLAGGVAAGHFLKPAPAPGPAPAVAEEYAAAPGADPLAAAPPHDPEESWDYAKFDNQFVVPVMAEGRVASMIVLSISLEVTPGQTNAVHLRQPKLRDGFLRVLFEHERAGGFQGVFTDTRVLGELRARLLDVARSVMGETVNDVLVTDILRQDL